MAIITAKCPDCGASLEFPHGVTEVSCAGCGNPYDAVTFKGAVALIPAGSKSLSDFAGKRDEDLMAALDETIGEIRSEVEAFKSQELGAPLELGCALFGAFGLVTLVLALFSTVAKRYFGGPIFYASLLVVIAFGAIRLWSKVKNRRQRGELRERRIKLENELKELEDLRERFLSLVQRNAESPPS
ncbi:MAG TPA: hypothetical protein VFV34_22780 [Blastocatellia bacterium]|nr:hypothetical protein [Blastocatellia bacterium]